MHSWTLSWVFVGLSRELSVSLWLSAGLAASECVGVAKTPCGAAGHL